MTYILGLFLFLGPVAIVYIGVQAVKHTIIIRKSKRIPLSAALMTSIMNMNGPDRKYGVR